MRSELGPHARRLIGRIELLSKGVLADDVRSALKVEVASHLLASTQAREELHASPKEADRAAAKAFGRVWPMIHGMYRDEVAAKAPSKRTQTMISILAGGCLAPVVVAGSIPGYVLFLSTGIGMLLLAILGFLTRRVPITPVRNAVLSGTVIWIPFSLFTTAISPNSELLLPRVTVENALRGIPAAKAAEVTRLERVQTLYSAFLANPAPGRAPLYQQSETIPTETWMRFGTLEETRAAWHRALPDSARYFADRQKRIDTQAQNLRDGLAASPLEKLRFLPQFLWMPVLVSAFLSAYSMLVGFAYAMAMSSLRHRLRRRRVNFRA
jgi:hypothetical protein